MDEELQEVESKLVVVSNIFTALFSWAAVSYHYKVVFSSCTVGKKRCRGAWQGAKTFPAEFFCQVDITSCHTSLGRLLKRTVDNTSVKCWGVMNHFREYLQNGILIDINKEWLKLNFSLRSPHAPQCQIRQKKNEIMLNRNHSVEAQDLPDIR